jgi:hypothetical protein
MVATIVEFQTIIPSINEMPRSQQCPVPTPEPNLELSTATLEFMIEHSLTLDIPPSSAYPDPIAEPFNELRASTVDPTITSEFTPD